MTSHPGQPRTPTSTPVTEPDAPHAAAVIPLAPRRDHRQRPVHAPASTATRSGRREPPIVGQADARAPRTAVTAGVGLTLGGDEHARAARSVTCPCGAQPGTPCRPAGDHLARYLHAGQSGAISRPALNELVSGLDVITTRRIITPPAEHGARLAGATTADQIVRAQLDAGMTADRIEASALRVLAGRHEQPTPVSEAFFRGYDDTAATLTREARELEAGA
jgi:hypothetical protein